MASVAGKPVIQPTGQEMLRYWQAFMSVKDAQYPHPVERTLLVSQPMVQIRLSVLASTIIACLIAITSAVASRAIVSRDTRSRVIQLPSSQFDWAAQACSPEHHKSRERPNIFASFRPACSYLRGSER